MEPNIKLGSVESITRNLRQRSNNDGVTSERIVAALARVGDIWESRLAPDSDWTPPDGSPFPWAQVRISLAGLIPGLKAAGEWLERTLGVSAGDKPPALQRLTPNTQHPTPRVASLILAGNTPLMSWSPMCACLLAGWSVFVKMSRDETLWPRLFAESLADADAAVAARLHLDVWPGDDKRTAELCRTADAVIAYGSDATIDALHAATPEKTVFFGFGHGISVGVWLRNCLNGKGNGEEDFHGFARDLLVYGQSGCLSPQAILIQGGAHTVGLVSIALMENLPEQAEALNVLPVTDAAIARRLREAEALAGMGGWGVFSDDFLRWTIARIYRVLPIPESVGFGFLSLLPFGEDFSALRELLEPLRGKISCIGVAGALTGEVQSLFASLGVSRICPAGEMQAPPLDWPNGNIDILRELYRAPS